MFRLPGAAVAAGDAGAVAHAVLDFIAGTWEEVDAEAVPPESAGRRRAGSGSSGGGGSGEGGGGGGKGGGGAGAAAALAAAAGRRLVAALGETGTVLRVTGIAALVVAVVIIAVSRPGVWSSSSSGGAGGSVGRWRRQWRGAGSGDAPRLLNPCPPPL
jgi:hypothetical protein